MFRTNMTGPHMGGDYQTDNTVVGYDPNHLVAWQTAPADTETLKTAQFPLVHQEQLEDSLSNLAAAVVRN